MPSAPTRVPLERLALARELADEFAATAVERDLRGGTPLKERRRIRSSGLLNLMIPTIHGGDGGSWITAFAISRELAKVDSSLAHVVSYHHLGITIPLIFGTAAHQDHFLGETVRRGWWWCNALNPLDRRCQLTLDGDGYRLNGIKSFCSGSHDADILPMTAVLAESGELMVLVLPTDREGIQIHDDWDAFGQRQTDSGRVSFHNVQVGASEMLGNRAGGGTAFGTIRACLTQLNLAHIFLGIAEGAFEAARAYTTTEARPWSACGVQRATEDPEVLRHYGDFWVQLQGTAALVERAAERLQHAWDQGPELSAEERGDCALAIGAAKVAATRAGLEITSRIFEVIGARGTGNRYGFDRYWRNLRTFSLHDPIDQKVRALGDWALNGQRPTPTFYI